MTDSSKRLGYGGAAFIAGTQVLITGGSFDQADAPATLDMLDLPSITSGLLRRGRVLHAPGTSLFTGSLGFDVTKNAIADFITVDKLLQRNWEFDVEIQDGENKYKMTDCLAQSVSLSGSPAGLISVSISFMGIEEKVDGTTAEDYLLNYDVTPDDQPIAYWWSGADDVRDWTFNYTQGVTPMYGNTTTMDPKYMIGGLVTYSLQVTTYSELIHDAVSIATTSFTLTGVTTEKGYTFNGPTDLGMYSHSFETASDTGASDGIIIV